jgi:predicted  nucleic acid-binding Zn-ribbon protein
VWKKIKTAFNIAIILILVGLLVFSSVRGAADRKELADLRAKAAATNRELQAAQSGIQAARRVISDLKSISRGIDTAGTNAETANNAAIGRLGELQSGNNEIEGIGDRISATNRELGESFRRSGRLLDEGESGAIELYNEYRNQNK